MRIIPPAICSIFRERAAPPQTIKSVEVYFRKRSVVIVPTPHGIWHPPVTTLQLDQTLADAVCAAIATALDDIPPEVPPVHDARYWIPRYREAGMDVSIGNVQVLENAIAWDLHSSWCLRAVGASTWHVFRQGSTLCVISRGPSETSIQPMRYAGNGIFESVAMPHLVPTNECPRDLLASLVEAARGIASRK